MSLPLTLDHVGPLIRLTAPGGISHHGQTAIGDTVWLAVNAYAQQGTYRTVYVALGAEERTLIEDQGVLPVLFAGPDGAPWAVVTNPYGDKDREVVRPIGGPPGKPMPPFVGSPLWLEGTTLLLVNTDSFSESRPDRWLRYDLTAGRRSIIKLPLPNRAHYVRNSTGIHSLARTSHRLLSPAGQVLLERPLDLTGMNVEPVHLVFDGDSTAIGTDGQTLWWLRISGDGAVVREKLVEGSFYSLWKPTHAPDGMVVTQYVGEGVNGWIVSRDGRLVQVTRSTERGYVDGAGKALIELPQGQWVLSGLSLLGAEVVATVYPRAATHRPDALWVARVPLPVPDKAEAPFDTSNLVRGT